MALQVGIVGLPNVGKSTLFNAVSAAGAEAANYPFATITPNVGVVGVPDGRLDVLARLAGSAKVAPTTVEFLDIAGLVQGASRGEGLGNQFLGYIRDVDAVVHVVRCFADPEVVHVDGVVDPARDIEVVETELLLADLDVAERRADRARRAAKSGGLHPEAALADRLVRHLQAGEPARTLDVDATEAAALRTFGLLTAKPVLYAANVAESDLPDGDPALVDQVRAIAGKQEAEVVVVCAEAEAQIAELAPGERAEFLADLGLTRSGLDQLITAAYRLLGLVTFFTAGPKETRAWTVRAGTLIPEAAGRIHTDLQRGFIRAEVISYPDYATFGGEAGARDAGRLRIEGKDYRITDGDVVHVRFNV